MIECDGNQVSDDIILEAFAIAQRHVDMMCDIQAQFLAKLTITPKQITCNVPSSIILDRIKGILTPEKIGAMMGHTKVSFNDMYYQYEKEVLEAFATEIHDATDEDFTEVRVKAGVFQVIKKAIRYRTLFEGKRLDDRPMDTIRSLYCEVGLFSRTHGTGLFWRGDTQVLTTLSLGAPSDNQVIDTMEEDQTEQKYIHHYNFP